MVVHAPDNVRKFNLAGAIQSRLLKHE